MTVAVRITPAVSSFLAFETIQAALETTGIVWIFFFFFFACTQNRMTCYNSLFMLSVRARSCSGRWSKKRRPRSTETNLPGSLSWQALWICAARKFITPTYRETNKQPNLRLPEPQLQQAVALLTFTAQCFSYPSSSPFFFFLLSCLKANNFLISKVV